MPLRKRERGSGMWGASRTVDEAGVWWAGQCGGPGSVVGRAVWSAGSCGWGEEVASWGRCQPVRSQRPALWGRHGPALG